MPFIQIKISGAGNSALAENVARRVVVLTHRHLHKDPALTAVAVEFVPAEQWFVAGKSLQAQKTRSFYLQISITDETNTKDEKAAYLAAVFALMNELLGGVHEKSYVHVVDARGAAYGYGGITQERRYVLATASAVEHRAPAPDTASALTSA